MIKRLISLITAAVMTAGLIPAVIAASAAITPTDDATVQGGSLSLIHIYAVRAQAAVIMYNIVLR